MRQKHKIFQLLSAAALSSFLLLAVGSAETDSEAEKISVQAPAATLSANQLYQEYDANQVAADSKYKDKVIIVTGSIKNIGKDITDTAYVVIGGEGFLDGVQCMLPGGQEGVVAQLSKGQFVTAKGRVSGQAIGNVLLRNCTLQ